MAPKKPKIMDLCRLCGKKHEFSKELLDESNKNVADLIRQFTQITVNACDIMPTKVCLDCEEKMVSFQLFILDCYRVQDALRQLCLEDEIIIKYEDGRAPEIDGRAPEVDGTSVDRNSPVDKIFSFDHSELRTVKAELSDENTNLAAAGDSNETFGVMTNMMSACDEKDFQNEEDDDFDDVDNIAIALLKQVKETNNQSESQTSNEAKLNHILQNPFFKVKDLVKPNCSKCKKKFKSWPQLESHYTQRHMNEEILVYCLCGFEIKNKSTLYRHVSEHKKNSRKEHKNSLFSTCSELDISKAHFSADQSVKDFINFECMTCKKKCTSWYNLKSHTERIHKISPVVKCVCGLVLKSKSVLYKHVTDHKRPGAFSCEKCAAVKKTAAALSKHMMRHIPKPERKYYCDSCDKSFNNKQLLQSHVKIHTPLNDRKIYQCESCNMRFTTQSSATCHKRVVHDKIKGFVCDLCGYACGTNGELRQHRAIHSDDKPFECRKCAKSFKTYSNLKTHMDTHEDTSYVCYVCSRVLNSRRTLRKHLLVHEDKLRHACSYCNKAFKRRQTLKVHMHMHTGDKPLSCKWCEEKFSYASTLRSHRLRCHPDKMVSQEQNTYIFTQHFTSRPQDYIKSDLEAIGMSEAKNEVEAM